MQRSVGRPRPAAVGGHRDTVHRDLIVVGDLNPDLIVEGDDVVPEFGQVEKLVTRVRLELGGASAITAAAAARLGINTAFVGIVGDDLWGRFAVEQLSTRGIDVGWCRLDPAWPTGLTIILSGRADRAILTAPGAIDAMTADNVDRAVLAGARHLHVGGAFVQPRLLAGLPALLADARAIGVTTSLDPNWDPSGRWDLEGIVPHLDLLLPNEAEAMAMTGADTAEAAASDLLEAMPAGALVVVKRGALGVVVRGGDTTVAFPAYQVRSIDAIGAGDTFDGALIAGLLRGLATPHAVRVANAAAALSTTAAGGTAAQPTWAEVETFVASHQAGVASPP